MIKNISKFREESLNYHSQFPSGKIQITPTKKYSSQRDLSLAYSPGVAEPCKEIARSSQEVYKYTSKGNLVAVITNGSAVLGLGDIGALASKPVMEGKALLFKIFSGIDVFDIEIDESDPEKFIETVKAIAPTFGGINLEDIKAPEAFEIERRLKKELSIPVMHDDQHGTAIISGAALLNAITYVGKKIHEIKMVVNGAGAAAISCTRTYKQLGVKPENILMFDSKGLLHSSRTDLNKEKKEFSVNTYPVPKLDQAIENADVFIGLSIGGILTPNMLKSMGKNPIVFAMANPDPEIDYNLAIQVRPDIIMATGRSDYPNQVNNVLGFPYIFRGALDVHASVINDEMKLAAVHAIASLAKEPVPEQVNIVYNKKNISFGKEYIIPKPFDNRLITRVAPAVAKAAMDSGVARNPILDWKIYQEKLLDRMGYESKMLRMIQNRARTNPKKVVFCNGEEYDILKSVQILHEEGIVSVPVVLGNEDRIKRLINENNLDVELEIVDPEKEENREKVRKFLLQILWERRNRKGLTLYDSKIRMRTNDHFGAMMVDQGEADAVITGYSRSFSLSLRPMLEVIGRADSVHKTAGMMILLTKRGPLFLADTAVIPDPTSEELARIALMASHVVKAFDIEPHIAMLSFQNFSSNSKTSSKVSQTVAFLHKKYPNLIVDGELQPDFALNEFLLASKFPFSKLVKKRANIFIFPNLESGNLTYKFIRGLGNVQTIGPVMLGMRKPAHVMQMQSSIEEIVNLATLSVIDAQIRKN
ncbi:bifunctional malate dehydrogenase (oxaloacetate-decarboxylating) (NADP+)/phosphate acetyltransferase [Blattabacterium sp. (Blattella germanica) str. Bge]|uniref:NADP-dependent malic enzyme n=1 Tax=Blattabacterium sp. (Blattella germanica) TaxID=624186 RepID=UPI0001BB61DA|nr:NADP-dependent malic enzyme [Blattabacterium sp. (Blattella germanica)]ACY40420.1 bifunctional malate dehydrogenase (oxaloacetate-decarboxylating) (NADP+)/phosphate acetyltransferase [Blattabacterium sp. (Blattella germanica) str. Bge]